MQSFSTSLEAQAERYTTLLQALCDISESYYYERKLDDANTVLQSGQQFLEAKEVEKRDQLKFLLQSGKILTNSIFYRSRNLENALTTVTHAKQLAALIGNEKARRMHLIY